MSLPRLSKLELQIMEALWTRGACSIREIQEAFPERNRPAYTTIQTTVYRLETKKALRRVKNAKIPIEYGPADEPWGVRRFFVRDPFGKLVNILAHR